MRLLKTNSFGEFSLTEFVGDDVPKYAILSHTWGADATEVTFKDLIESTGTDKAGYAKLQFCGNQAIQDGLQYFWVDTCCIDKSSSAELTESINSMFQWYREAAKCYVYLADVSKIDLDEHHENYLPRSTWKSAFRGSRWFTRGWTLQELIAPESVEFFSAEGIRLGNKISMKEQIHEITGISIQALQGAPLSNFSIEERLSWAKKRNTTRKEDGAYSLLGIFDIHMPLIYGEGKKAFTRLKEEINKNSKGTIKIQDIDGMTKLKSDSIFPQQRLLVREDVESFLTQAFCRDGVVRAVLHGLPGVGKSTMARHFAYKNRGDMAVLWIPASSELEIVNGLEKYVKQIYGETKDCSEPVSTLGQALSERFLGKWLVVLDGLDDPSINIQRYLFADLPMSKILVTTTRRDLASQIGTDQVLQINSLDENTALDFLNICIISKSNPAVKDSGYEKNLTLEERKARRYIVKELGGLPLAISIVGSSMRDDIGIPSMNCQAYLTWSDKSKDVLLEKDPEFIGYSSSIWKAFTFAFQNNLSDHGEHQHTASMANFIASCENASNFATYFQLYQQLKANEPRRSAGLNAIDQLGFLENEFFEHTVAKLAAVNMITLNWTRGGSSSLPYIEMHSLVKKWLERRNSGRILSYTAAKTWLLGFGMYDQMIRSRVGLKQFNPLMKEIKESFAKGSNELQFNCIPRTQVVFPFVVEAQKNLSAAVDHLPAGSKQLRCLRRFSEKLAVELIDSCSENLGSIEWLTFFQAFAEELELGIESAVEIEARRETYMPKDFFLETLDSYGCIPIAFQAVAPYEMSIVGQTNLIQDLGTQIADKAETMLLELLSRDAITEATVMAHEDSSTSIRRWSENWGDDVAEIIRRCLNVALAKRGSIEETGKPLVENVSGVNAMTEESSISGLFQAMTDSSSPKNAFFAVLRQTVKRSVGEFLASSPAVDILDTQRDIFMNICKVPMQRYLEDRAPEYFATRPDSSQIESKTIFSVLWELAWPARFLGSFEDLIAKVVVDSISNYLKRAAKTGFISIFENHCQTSPSFLGKGLAEDLAECVFDKSSVSNLFPNWISSGWIDIPSDDDDDDNDGDDDDDDSDDDEGTPSYISLLNDAKISTLNAMKAVYDNDTKIAEQDLVQQAVKQTLECRRALHQTVMDRLNQPNLTDQTGLGALFAKLCFPDCDKDLRSALTISGITRSEDDLAALEGLVEIETEWRAENED